MYCTVKFASRKLCSKHICIILSLQILYSKLCRYDETLYSKHIISCIIYSLHVLYRVNLADMTTRHCIVEILLHYNIVISSIVQSKLHRYDDKTFSGDGILCSKHMYNIVTWNIVQ